MRKLLAFLFIGALTACGGSSDGDSSDSPNPDTSTQVTITPENSIQVSAAVTNAVISDGIPNGFELFGDLFLQGISIAKPTLDFPASMKTAFENVPDAGTIDQIGDGGTIDCDVSGSVTITVDFAEQGQINAGDQIGVVFDMCSEDDEVIDGSFTLTFTAFSGDIGGNTFDVGFMVEFASFVSTEENETFSVNGDISMRVTLANGSITSSMESNEFTVVADGLTHSITNYEHTTTIDQSTLSLSITTNGTFTSEELGGTVTFETLEPFTLSSTGDDPVSGKFKITGADGASITITVQNAVDLLLEIDTDGDGEIDETINTTWEDLQDFFDS